MGGGGGGRVRGRVREVKLDTFHMFLMHSKHNRHTTNNLL